MNVVNSKIYTLDELRMRLYPIFQGYDIKKAIIFGSYGKGKATPKSDIDLLVDSGLTGLKFVGLIEEIRENLDNKDVDVFDVRHVVPGSVVQNEIERTGVEIYAK